MNKKLQRTRRIASCLGVCLALLLARTAPALEWSYAAHEGDNLWALAKEYLVDMRHWGEFRALNDVPNPRRMQPGTRIRFPVQWLRVQPAPAMVTAVSGEVRITNPEGVSASASVGATLVARSGLSTGADASAVLRFADGSTMLVRPGSDVRMDDLGAYGRRAMVDTRARLQRGRVEVQVPGGGGSRMEITTPSASALVRGTRFRVASEEQLARVEVLEGGVRVAGDVGRVDLPAGTGTVVRPGEPSAPPRTLLPAPGLANIPRLIERRSQRLRWADLPGAAGYRVQFARSGQDLPLLDVPAQTSAIELPDVADGRYQLQVRAVDDLGLEGLGARREFVLNARPEPPATLGPRPGQTVRVTRPVLRWTEPADAARFHVQLATDAAFSQPVFDRADVTGASLESPEELPAGGYHWRIATVDGAGEQGPYGDVQAFMVRPAPPAPGEADTQVGEADVLLRWRAGQPGQTYEVELAPGQDFAVDTRTEATLEPQLIIPTPNADVWFRVRIVDSDGYRGPFGTPQRIEAPRQDPWWLLAVPLLLLLL